MKLPEKMWFESLEVHLRAKVLRNLGQIMQAATDLQKSDSLSSLPELCQTARGAVQLDAHCAFARESEVVSLLYPDPETPS